MLTLGHSRKFDGNQKLKKIVGVIGFKREHVDPEPGIEPSGPVSRRYKEGDRSRTSLYPIYWHTYFCAPNP